MTDDRAGSDDVAVDPPATDGGVVDGATAVGGRGGPPGGDGPGADDEEVEPVEVLVGLAEAGEIDPWDIDVVSVTDKFLAHLDEADLRTSGRALFYASVLLRMKSDVLLDPEANEDDEGDDAHEPDPWSPFGGPGPAMGAGEGEFGDGAAGGDGTLGGDGADGDRPPLYDPVDALEAEMERRLDRKSARGTPETLEGLVRELRSAERESWWKESRSYDTSNSPQGFRRGTQTLDYRSGDEMREAGEPTTEDVTGTTHGEDMQETTAAVREALAERFERGRDAVLFAEVEMAAGSRVLSYLGLLFLTHDGEIVMEQDELFGDLWIRDVGS